MRPTRLFGIGCLLATLPAASGAAELKRNSGIASPLIAAAAAKQARPARPRFIRPQPQQTHRVRDRHRDRVRDRHRDRVRDRHRDRIRDRQRDRITDHNPPNGISEARIRNAIANGATPARVRKKLGEHLGW